MNGAVDRSDQAGSAVADVPATVLGVTGQSWRSYVAPWGDATVCGAGEAVDVRWFVAAEDRWHVPSVEPAVRQRRLEGTPVVETRLRIPDGDAVLRTWAVADHGGLTVIEVENESPLPFAVAFSGGRILTERAPTAVPIQGIELPEDAIVLPVGHRASVRVAVANEPTLAGNRLPSVAPALAVARGWLAVVHRASRLVLPDDGMVEAVTAARCDLLLDGPVDPSDDPAGFLLDVAELARLGDDADAWMPEIVEPVARIARTHDVVTEHALDACERLAIRAGDDRAAADISRIRLRRGRQGHRDAATSAAGPTSMSDIRRGDSVGRFVDAVERRIADGGSLLPSGIPRRWLGADFEVHGVPTGPRSAVSFAVRWHGERPAVLWEQQGEPQELSAPSVDPGWRTREATGEALWAAPPQPTRLGVSIDP